ncbi:phosphotransferase [Sulfitobacter aestuarii]|uniref:Phosphotransferase n=1 Tax=Sulfitobacter aestuarii TaxID=2161676 RepID=A0ABW5TYH1_9RHOB
MKHDFWSEESVTARLDAANSLTLNLTRHPEVQTFALDQEIKASDEARVYRATLNGAPVIIKRFHSSNKAEIVLRAKTELDHLERVFKDGDCQANRCVLAAPEEGILVLSYAPGRRLDEVLDNLSGEAREKVLAHCGRWIVQYAEGRSEKSRFWPRRWIGLLEGRSLDHISNPDDLALLDRLFKALRRRVPIVREVTALRAAVHGDFVGMNAHYCEGVLYGFDTQGECWMFVAREVARFLVWQQIHDNTIGAARKFGIYQADWKAMLSSGVLSEEEQSTTLPFFVGEQLYVRFVNDYHRERIRANCQSGIKSFLAEAW